MRRIGRIGIAVVVAAVVAACAGAPDPVGGGERFIAATLPGVSAPRVVEPDFTRAMYDAATLKDFAGPLDACQGPVAIAVPSKDAVLVSEHDYCGGSAWISKLRDGSTVRLSGEGIQDGFYEVVTRELHPRHRTRVGDLPRTPVVLQTCVSTTRMVLIGLQPIVGAVAA